MISFKEFFLTSYSMNNILLCHDEHDKIT